MDIFVVTATILGAGVYILKPTSNSLPPTILRLQFISSGL